MDTLLYETPLNEKAVLPSPVIGLGFWTNLEKQVQQKGAIGEYNNHTEYTEIDLFTGQIRTICRR